MLSAEIEKTISFAVQVAQEAHHEFVTTEHLLLALLDNRSAQQVISACGGEIELLRDDLVRICPMRKIFKLSQVSVFSALFNGRFYMCRVQGKVKLKALMY